MPEPGWRRGPGRRGETRKSAPAAGGLEPPTASRGCIRLCPILTTCLLVYGTLMLSFGAELAECGCGAGEGATTGEWMLLCRCWCLEEHMCGLSLALRLA